MFSQTDNSFRLTIDHEETVLEHPMTMGAVLRVPTQKLAERFFQATDNSSGLLPPVVRYVSSDFKRFLIERPPFVALVTVTSGDGAHTTYKLPMPWTVYALEFDKHNNYESMHIFARNSAIFSEEDKLFFLPVPNLYASGKICFGGTFDGLLEDLANTVDVDSVAELPTETLVNGVINGFWSSIFNMDLDYFLSHYPEYFNNWYNEYEDGSIDSFFSGWSNLDISDMLEIEYSPLHGYNDIDSGPASDTVSSWMEKFSKSSDMINPNSEDVVSESKQPFLDFIRLLALSVVNDED